MLHIGEHETHIVLHKHSSLLMVNKQDRIRIAHDKAESHKTSSGQWGRTKL